MYKEQRTTYLVLNLTHEFRSGKLVFEEANLVAVEFSQQLCIKDN